jgi:hypothetical protein
MLHVSGGDAALGAVMQLAQIFEARAFDITSSQFIDRVHATVGIRCPGLPQARHFVRSWGLARPFMADSYDTVRDKVGVIFRELAGERARALDGTILPAAITSAITAALSSKDSTEQEVLHKDEIAFHLTDWNCDAAFLVALHLFPERFTPEEIRAGVDLFLVYVPSGGSVVRQFHRRCF